MNKRIKIIIVVLVIFAGAIVVYNITKDVSKPSSQETNSQPAAINEEISPKDRQKIQEFVENFLLLYNTYSYEDYSNLQALGDYQTQNAQKQTLERIEKLKADTPIGFKRTVRFDEVSLKIEKLGVLKTAFRVSAKLTATDSVEKQAPASPRSSDAQGGSVDLQAELRLVPYNQGWLVDDILINE